MGSILGPAAAHVPHLPEQTVADRLLSAPQLETVVDSHSFVVTWP